MLLAVTKHFRTYRIRSPVVISIHLSGCENISGFFAILFSHYFYCFLIYKHPQICYYFERSEIIVFAEYKQTQRTREYICWPHYREFPEGVHVSFDLEKSVVTRTGRNCSIPVAEREVQVQMEDGLGEVQSRWASMSMRQSCDMLEMIVRQLFRLQQDRLL